jgi:brefeldin A-inhibited guanine nucleotide-exchange protein
MVRGLVGKMLECPETVLPSNANANGVEDNGGERNQVVNANDDPMLKYWLPVLNSFYEIIMTGEDLEVRRL